MLKNANSSAIEVKNIANKHEKMWSLGTDILQNSDLKLMEEGKGTAFSREYGAIYSIICCSYFVSEIEEYGYSEVFQSLVKEGIRRGYEWLFFDCDIDTETLA